jgi:DNA-binding CsgD family transcriptional regulator
MESHDEEIVDLLRKILAVLAFQVSSGISVTEGARALKFAGLDNQMIADVLNTSPATVRTLTTNLRAKRAAGIRRKKTKKR